jgi:MFS family permease
MSLAKVNSMINLRVVFRSMKYRNYRLFFIGQGISLTGTWMQLIALSWLVYRMTNSALLLGLVGFAGQIPTFILAPLAGVVADRYNKRRVLIITQALAMAQAFILSVLVLSGNIAVWHIVALSIFLGLVNSFDIPTRHSFVVEIIDSNQDLGNAVALNSSLFNVARLIGPSLAGILIALVGEGVCFLINAISYIAIFITLISIRLTPRKTIISRQHIFQELKEGFVYAYNFTPIRTILLILALISLMGVPYQVLMPVFARDIFHGGPATMGYLMAVSGAGALAGAIYLAGRESVIGLNRIIAVSSGVFGIGVIIFGMSTVILFSVPFIFIIGFAMMVQMAASNTVLQTIVEEGKRGRVMSMYTMAFMGTMPFGSLMAGGLADIIGAPNTLLIGGACCIAGSFVFARRLQALRQKVRPIYIKKGIIPEVAQGIEAASGLKGLSA